jgi:hypothetical protein
MASRRSRNQRDKRAEAAEVQRTGWQAPLRTGMHTASSTLSFDAMFDVATRRLADEAAESARDLLAKKP